jgi:hypothetical protein
MLILGLYKPHKIVAKLAGYFGILCWFIFGFSVAAIRITLIFPRKNGHRVRLL